MDRTLSAAAIAMVILGLVVAGCGGDSGGITNGQPTTTTDTGPAATGTPDRCRALYGRLICAPDTGPAATGTPDATPGVHDPFDAASVGSVPAPPTFPSPPAGQSVRCEGAKPAGTGRAWPVTGLDTPAGRMTCTECPTGESWLQGRWRWFQETAERYLFLDVYDFSGNTFTETIIGEDDVLAPGKTTVATITGYYICPKKDDLGSKRRVFEILTVDPPGAYGNQPGDTYACDMLPSDPPTNYILWCDFTWDGVTSLKDQLQFCREGSPVGEGTCTIP